MTRLIRPIACLCTIATGITACADDASDTTDPAGVEFEAPVSGAKFAGSVPLAMSASGMVIEPAGAVRDGAGHFHVIADHGCVTTGDAITKGADHLHFGDGATTGKVYLGPGTHTLCLQVGDGQHTALDITDTVEIDVGVTSTAQWCDVLTEIDELAASLSDHDFTAVQTSAGHALPLLEQLLSATSYVDADVRPAVEQYGALATQMFEVYLDAPSAADAQSMAWGPEGILATFTDAELDAIEHDAGGWFESTCDVTVLD